MEVKAGYKQTAIGVIPEDWAVTTFGNFIAIRRGHDLTARQRRKGHFPVMGSAGQNGYHDTAIAKGPGVVIGRSGASYGQAHFCDEDYWPHNTALYVTDFLGNDPRFVFYFLKSIDFSRHNSGGAQQSLNRNFIAPIDIAIPPLSEQIKIAKAIWNIATLIASLNQMIIKKRDLKQAAMQQLLIGKTRLQGFSGEWEAKRLGDVVSISKGQMITQGSVIAGDIPVIAGGKRPAYYHNTANRQGTTITVSSSGASAGYVAIHRYPIFASDCCTIGEGFNYAIDFIYYVLQLKQNDIYRSQTGGAQPHIHPKDLKPLIITFPSDLSEQKAIATVLTEMDAELTELEQRRDKTIALKQGMMQELLTGRTRLV